MSAQQTAQEMLDAIKQSFEEIKTKQAEAETRFGPMAGELSETKEAWDKATKRLDALEAKMQRALDMAPRPGDPGAMPAEYKAHQEDYARYLVGQKSLTNHAERYAPEGIKGVHVMPVYAVKNGRNHLAFEYRVYEPGSPEYKAISIDSDPAGGFLTSPTMSQQVIQRVFDTSPMRQYATVITISGDAWEEPVDDDDFGSGWVGETESRAETTTSELDKIRIPLHEVYAKPRATQKSLDLIGSRVETWLSGKVSDKIVRTENTAFCTGNSDKRPRGLSQYVNDSAAAWNKILSVASGAAAALTFDGFIGVRSSLQAQYLPNSNWFMNRTTRAAARKLKDGEGQYLWQPNNQLGDPDTLDGRPVVIFEDIPDVGASAYPVYFGDMMQGYYVVDHTQGIRTLRDPYSAKPYVEFYTTKYVGGGIRNGRALRVMKISAS